MKPFSLALLCVFALATTHAAVVAPPDGKDNALAAPVAPNPTATQVTPPKDAPPGGVPPADPAAPLPTNPTPADPAPPGYVPEKLTYNDQPMVRVDVLMVSVPEEKAIALIRQLRDPLQFAAAEKSLIDMIGRKEANLEGWPEVTTHSQVRAVAESIVEQRYPIEFSTPNALTSPAPDAKPADKKADARLVDEALALASHTSGVIPTTFETRNTGATLEVDPIVSPDRTAITMSLAPQLVRFDHYENFPAGTTAKGEKINVPQPIFTTSKVSTTLSLRDGERRLIHIGKSTSDRSRVDLFILGAKIQAPPAGPQ